MAQTIMDPYNTIDRLRSVFHAIIVIIEEHMISRSKKDEFSSFDLASIEYIITGSHDDNSFASKKPLMPNTGIVIYPTNADIIVGTFCASVKNTIL